MIKTIKTKEEMAYYVNKIDNNSMYFVTVWSCRNSKAKLSKMKIKTTHKHKKMLLVYYYSDILKGTYLSAVADISNVEVYKPEKLHNSGEPRRCKKC